MPSFLRFLAVGLLTLAGQSAAPAGDVEQWGRFELTLKGPADGNPFVGGTLFVDPEYIAKVQSSIDMTTDAALVEKIDHCDVPVKIGIVIRLSVSSIELND